MSVGPDVGYLVALVGGALALLSPCSALLLPSFFAVAFSGRTQLLARTTVFTLGLAAIMVPLGAAASSVGALFTLHRQTVVTVAGVVVIVLGVVQILGGGFSLRPAEEAGSRLARRGTWAATLALGAVYGFAGFCTGPILGAVLTVAAASASPLRGGALLAVYALGMAVPLYVLAALWERFDLGRRRWLRGRAFRVGPLWLHTTTTVSGLLFVAVGVLVLVFDGTAALGSLLGLPADAGTAAGVEERVTAAAGGVGDVVLLGVLALVVVVVTAWRLRRARRGTRAGSPEAWNNAPSEPGA